MSVLTTVVSELNVTETSKQDLNSTCVKKTKYQSVGFFVVVLVCVLILLFLVVAVTVFRNKLQSRVVNIYAANVIVACTFSCILRLSLVTWSTFSLKEMHYQKDNVSSVYLHVWMVSKVINLATFLIILSGITLVVNALRLNIFRINRTVAGISFKSDRKRKEKRKKTNRLSNWLHQHSHAEATLWVLASWLLPVLVCSVVGLSVEQCLHKCHCYFDYVPKNSTIALCGSGCSYLWPPLSNLSLIIVSSLWILFVLLTIGLFVRCKIDFDRVSRKMTAPITLDEEDKPSEPEQDSFNPDKLSQGPVSPTSISTKVATLRRLFSRKSQNSSLLLMNLKKNLLVLFFITVVFILGSVRTVIVGLFGVASPESSFILQSKKVWMFPLNVLETLAETIVPICLCLTLPALRTAVYSMLEVVIYCVTCKCCLKPKRQI